MLLIVLTFPYINFEVIFKQSRSHFKHTQFLINKINYDEEILKRYWSF